MSDATQTHSHQETPAKKIRRSRTQWQRIMKKYETSGLSQPTFCVQEGLAQHLFCKWRKKLISGCRPALIDDSDKLFVEVPAVDRETQPVLQWDVELAFANGMVLRLRQGRC